jgi:hypothetical protein
VATIQAEQAALASAQQSAHAVAGACSAAGATVSAMSGIGLAGCDKIGSAAQAYASTDATVGSGMRAQ